VAKIYAQKKVIKNEKIAATANALINIAGAINFSSHC